MNKAKFIKTSDEKNAEVFRNNGYKELPKEGNTFVFINEPGKNMKLVFDKTKVVFTNSLAI